jgi:Cu2+-containing amine oxidase
MGDRGLNPDDVYVYVDVWAPGDGTTVGRNIAAPNLPTETIGFRIVPDGFFDWNPALDVPK